MNDVFRSDAVSTHPGGVLDLVATISKFCEEPLDSLEIGNSGHRGPFVALQS